MLSEFVFVTNILGAKVFTISSNFLNFQIFTVLQTNKGIIWLSEVAFFFFHKFPRGHNFQNYQTKETFGCHNFFSPNFLRGQSFQSYKNKGRDWRSCFSSQNFPRDPSFQFLFVKISLGAQVFKTRKTKEEIDCRNLRFSLKFLGARVFKDLSNFRYFPFFSLCYIKAKEELGCPNLLFSQFS